MRKLTPAEIRQLTAQCCRADDWNTISVDDRFSTEHIFHTRFSGEVTLGVFETEFELPGGVKKHAGLRHVTLHRCRIGNNVLVENVQNYIANYVIGNDVCIQNVDQMLVDGRSTFGNGVEVSVLNETGGREVMINDKLSSHFAYIMSLYRHRPELIRKMQAFVRFYAEKHASDMGEVGDRVFIQNTGSIRNVRIGSHARITGACRLENGTINSNGYDPVTVGHGVVAEDFILSSGARVEDGVMLRRCFVGQACRLGHNYSAGDSLFFSNCQGENGEACAIFAGPYTVTHHKSTLLIAGMFSFMNAGSGSNQSNHMYKLGPIHQGIIERGGKTTSDSYILWPARIGAFSLIMGRHYRNSDTSDMPFSYLIESGDESLLVPGVNLRSVGTIRDAQKFPRRDNRRDPNRLDQINFNLLSPYTVQKMFAAIDILTDLQRTCGATSDSYTYQSCRINNASLKRGLMLYNMAIRKFLGNSIISRLEKSTFGSESEIRAALRPDTPSGTGEWLDMAGLLAPRSEINRLLDDIESGKIAKLKDINRILEDLHQRYYSLEWTWAWEKIRQYYGLSPDAITVADIIRIVEQWQEAVVGLDKILYEDAKKEFSLSSRTGFGADGNSNEQALDFEQVRGAFEQNAFVKAILEHIETKTALGNRLIERLRRLAHSAQTIHGVHCEGEST
jgi:NDP-sugar pyrophosphorylase family protein